MLVADSASADQSNPHCPNQSPQSRSSPFTCAARSNSTPIGAYCRLRPDHQRCDEDLPVAGICRPRCSGVDQVRWVHGILFSCELTLAVATKDAMDKFTLDTLLGDER